MKSSLNAICLTLVLALGTISSARSADLQRGYSSYAAWDYGTALRVFTTLSKQGNVEAQFMLGLMHYKGEGVPQDYKTAVTWYALAAEQGNAIAQTNLGVMYQKGKGVP